MDWLSNYVTEAINSFLNGIIEEYIQLFGDILVKIMGIAGIVLDYPAVKNGILYAQGIAGAILVAKVANDALQTYILRTNGDPDADPGGLLVRTFKAAAVISCVPWIVRWIYEFGTTMANDIATLKGVQSVTDLNAFFSVTYLVNGSGVMLVITIVGLIMLLFVFLQTFIRAAELGLLAVIGPVLALSLSSTNTSMFSAWFRETIIISVSQALQIFMVKTAFYAFSYGLTDTSMKTYAGLMFLGWIWVTLKTPKFLKQFAYASGLGSASGGAAQSAITMVVMKAVSKGAA